MADVSFQNEIDSWTIRVRVTKTEFGGKMRQIVKRAEALCKQDFVSVTKNEQACEEVPGRIKTSENSHASHRRWTTLLRDSEENSPGADERSAKDKKRLPPLSGSVF
jgi:hypothetical protein